MGNVLCIKIFGSRTEAEIAKSALSAGHIDAYLDADDAGGMYPFPLSGTTKGVRLFIRPGDRIRAKKILHI